MFGADCPVIHFGSVYRYTRMTRYTTNSRGINDEGEKSDKWGLGEIIEADEVLQWNLEEDSNHSYQGWYKYNQMVC